jgi:dihydrofolate reductase
VNKPTICGIVAVGPDDVIGRNGVMPWYSRRDFYHFRLLTTPYPCIFGKNTFEKLPIRPLPNRLNIVCSSANKNEFQNGVYYANSVESAIEHCRNDKYIFVCGGQKIYEYAIKNDLIDVMYITKLYDDKLAKDVNVNRDKYVRFPINTNLFFDSLTWVAKKMVYPDNSLPKEYGDIKAKFFKCIRAR